MEQENINESIGETVETVADEQSEENLDRSEVEIQLDNLRDEINKHDQNIATMLSLSVKCLSELRIA